MNILITGMGYLASHICAIANQNDHIYLISRPSPLFRSQSKLISEVSKSAVTLTALDLNDTDAIEAILRECDIQVVLHFAWDLNPSTLSINQGDFPNLKMTKSLIDAMRHAGVRKLIFASSAAVYGNQNEENVDEDIIPHPDNFYGLEKLQTETYLTELFQSEQGWSIVCLRFFNITGYHQQLAIDLADKAKHGLIDELALDAVLGNKTTLSGNFIRDYIHVVDAAKATFASIPHLQSHQKFEVINIGSGTANRPSELITIFEQACDISLNIEFKSTSELLNRCVADIKKSQQLLGVAPEITVAQICYDAWRRMKLKKSND